MRAVQAALRSLGITRVRSWLVRFHLPSASCAAGWTTAVAFASSPCHCAAGSTMLVVLSERNFSSCAAGSTMLFGLTERNFSSCAAGSTMLVLLSTKIFFLCCRVDDSLCCRVGPAHSCAAGSQTPGDFGQCSGDDVEATLAVLQGG